MTGMAWWEGNTQQLWQRQQQTRMHRAESAAAAA